MDIRSKIVPRTSQTAGTLGAAGAYLAGASVASLIVVMLVAGFSDRHLIEDLVLTLGFSLPGSVVGTALAAALARRDWPKVTGMPRRYFFAAYAVAGVVFGPVVTGATAFLSVVFMMTHL